MSILCKLLGHKLFVNQQFCTLTGAQGPRTMRCRRCWYDIETLPPIPEDEW